MLDGSLHKMQKLSKKTRKQLARFLFAMSSFQSALRASEKLMTLNRDSEDTDTEYEHLQIGMCVTYARPFTENCGLGALPRDFLKPSEKASHESIMKIRHEVFGHTDAKASSNNALPMNRMIVAREGANLEFKPVVLRASDETLEDIIQHIRGLIDRCKTDLKTCYDEIDFSSVPEGKHILNLDFSTNDFLAALK